MARYDKYDPKAGGFRAPLAGNLNRTDKTGNGNPIGVGLDANGRVVTGGGGVSGFSGVLVTTSNLKAADIVDVMTDGEIVECAGLVAGTTYFLDATGVLTAAGPAAGVNGFKVGHTVEAGRLVVRFQRVQG